MPTELLDLWPLQPTAGRFDIVDDEVRFVARFPLVPGASYSLLVDGVEVAAARLPAPGAEAVTRVEAIYPSTRVVPLNQLKLYVHFSNPMSEAWAGRAIHVRRADDERVLPGVFLPMEPELWDRTRQRLTLLLDPGRIKRGLAPQAELGYPLEEGVPIVVAVDPSFQDAVKLFRTPDRLTAAAALPGLLRRQSTVRSRRPRTATAYWWWPCPWPS